jgi:c-di-GMP-related signal transduction protein
MYTNPDIPPSYEVSLQAKLNDANQEIGALTERLSAAEQRGYERALDDFVMLLEHGVHDYNDIELRGLIDQLKSDYLRQEGKNGKQS